MSSNFSPQSIESNFGTIKTDLPAYCPLDNIKLSISGRAEGDSTAQIRICDPDMNCYLEAEVTLKNNNTEYEFKAQGATGNHYVFLTWAGESHHSRYINFRVECQTCIESGDSDIDELFPFTKQKMLLGRREYNTDAGKISAYIAADTIHFDGIWLRDWIYGQPAYRYWEIDLTCALDRFLDEQDEEGMIPDGIERDGSTWRVGLESDVEYILVLGVWRAWQSNGNNKWMEKALPRLEKALSYITSSPKHWDPEYKLVKRQHSCDTWDFDIAGMSDKGEERSVIATCDQSGYVLAFRAMSEMYKSLGRKEEADSWAEKAAKYKKRAHDLLWDGTKYQHHFHLEEIDHSDFNEKEQLAMGNTWAMTRGLADREHAEKIIEEYRRRHQETGDKHPWWSLQPGYPDRLNYFEKPHLKQGGYANGGLMPWVGGELCRAAFLNGEEKYAVELLRDYIQHLKDTGGAKVWYWPDGQPGYRTRNEVDCAGWGMAEWINALVEGLAGIRDVSGQMRKITLSPNWLAADINQVYTCFSYPSSKTYFAYKMQTNLKEHTITFECAGNGESASLKIPLPERWKPETVKINNVEKTFNVTEEAGCTRVEFETTINNYLTINIKCAT
ncbi:MAG: alpha-L-rhamnosidase-related protein [Planctomycetota bacterium]|jgi:hypothetical protein